MPSLAEFAAATLTAYLGDVNAIHPLREATTQATRSFSNRSCSVRIPSCTQQSGLLETSGRLAERRFCAICRDFEWS
jgi:glutamine synthetase